MTQNARISHRNLVQKIRRNKNSKRNRQGWQAGSLPSANRSGRIGTRFEHLEPRMMMHGDTINHDPSYDPTSAYHIHADLTIWVNGQKVTVPQGVGDTIGIHTHDDLGTMHIHPNTTVPNSRTQFITLNDFFEAWRTDPDTEDRNANARLSSTQLLNNTISNTHSLQMFVNGVETNAFQTYKIHDGDDIVLVYSSNPVVLLNTNQGSLPVELLRDRAPGTVNNFLNYVNDGDYNNSVFHRYVPGFVIQGGGFRTNNVTYTSSAQLTNIPTDPAIQNEFGLSNTVGTLAMAKLGGNPNSATNQFFINLGNNSANLDNQNGGFTVFARLLDESFLTRATSLVTRNEGSAFTDLPFLADGDTNNANNNQLVVLQSVTGDGVIRGTVFRDNDADGTRDSGEVGISGTVIFADTNNNGNLDSGESSATTDSNGVYTLMLPSGQHLVRQIRRPEFNQTFPTGETQTVIVQVGREVTDINFANQPTSVAFRFEVTDTNGNPITSPINVNDEFLLRVFTRDTRVSAPNGFGVFAAYLDLNFDASRLSTVGNRTFVAPFTNGQSGSVQASGQLDEVGAFANSLSPTGQDEALVFTQRFRATRSGSANFTGDAPDQSPSHDVLLFGTSSPVPASQLFFDRTSVSINGPTALNDVFNVNEDSTNTTLDVLANDGTQGNTTNLTIFSTGTPNRGGTVTISSDRKTLSYTPATNFFGEETFTYTGTDGGTQYTATAVVQVFPVNDAPDAINNSFTVEEASANNFLDVLGNDIIAPDQNDPNENLQVQSVSTSARGGTVTRGPSGTHVLYTPPANFSGTDTFTYTITDRATNGLTDTATATVTVTAINHAPVANTDTFTVTEDTTNNLFDVLINDSIAPDVGETLTVTALTQGNRGGTVSIQQNGTRVSYSPAANFAGTETFTYTISDGTKTATGTATVTVTNVNDPPTAANDTFLATTNAANAVVNVLGNDSSAPDSGEVLSVQSVTQGSQGGIVTLSNGTVQYRSAQNFQGDETFTYTISDGSGLTATATVTVNVRSFQPSSISGFVFVDDNGNGTKDTNEAPIAGSLVTLQGTDSFGVAVQRSVTSTSDGKYEFLDLPPGTYSVAQTQPLFLADGQELLNFNGAQIAANDLFSITLPQNTNATANNFAEVGRQAAFFSIRDLFASTPRQSAFAALSASNQVAWSSPGLGWEGVAINSIQPVPNSNQLRVNVTPTGSAQQLTTTIDSRDVSKVQVLGEQDGTKLYRILGQRSDYQFQAVSNGASGEGEGHAVLSLSDSHSANNHLEEFSGSDSEQSEIHIPTLDALFARVGQATVPTAAHTPDVLDELHDHDHHDHESSVDQLMASGLE